MPLRRGNVKFVDGIGRRADSIIIKDNYTIRRFLVRLKVIQDGKVLASKNGDAIMKVTGKKSAVYTWAGMNEKITSPAKK